MKSILEIVNQLKDLINIENSRLLQMSIVNDKYS